MKNKANSDNSDLLGKSIPMAILRSEVAKIDPDFKAKPKGVYLKKLKEKNKKLYDDLSNYYSSIRERRIFICKLNEKHKTQFKNINLILEKLGKLRHKQKNGNIYEVKNLSYYPNEKMIFFKIIIHSDLLKFAKEKPTMDGNYNLDYRDKNSTISFLHLSPICLEVRTAVRKKAELTSEFLNSELFQDTDGFVIYTLTDDEKKKLAGTEGLRYKEAVMDGLSLEGCEQIILKGEDIESTLKYLKENNIDLINLSKQWTKSKIEATNQQFKFYDSGKISIKRKLENPFKIISEVVFRNEKQK